MPCRAPVNKMSVRENLHLHSQSRCKIDNQKEVFIKKRFTFSRDDEPLRTCFHGLPNYRLYFGKGQLVSGVLSNLKATIDTSQITPACEKKPQSPDVVPISYCWTDLISKNRTLPKRDRKLTPEDIFPASSPTVDYPKVLVKCQRYMSLLRTLNQDDLKPRGFNLQIRASSKAA
jgi:hypothetical protein